MFAVYLEFYFDLLERQQGLDSEIADIEDDYFFDLLG